MGTSLYYLDRNTGEKKEELVYGKTVLEFLYGPSPFAKFLNCAISKFSLASFFYGLLQKTSFSKRKIIPFIKKYKINTKEFVVSPDRFSSFNDFFTRKLKKECRPIFSKPLYAVIPADARYRFYPCFSKSSSILVKGEKFDLKTLIEDEGLAERYKDGSLILARLCPTDYHRFHFPCSCVPQEPKKVDGSLFSVNPIALKKNIHILSKNKRMITLLHSAHFGQLLYIEIGATNVGTIHQTFTPGQFYDRGDEKGYFSFGGSSLIILFEPGKIKFESDLQNGESLEIFCQLGQPLGKSVI